MASAISPLTARFAHRWHAELAPDGLWHVGDEEGHHLRKHFFTVESARAYAAAL